MGSKFNHHLLPLSFSFGGEEMERLEIRLLRLEEPIPFIPDSMTWVSSQIIISAGGFRGSFDARLTLEDFPPFLSQLCSLQETLEGTAVFSTIEEQIEIAVSGDGCGHMTLTGTAVEGFIEANRLHFTIHLDQSQLLPAIEQLNQLFPKVPRFKPPAKLPAASPQNSPNPTPPTFSAPRSTTRIVVAIIIQTVLFALIAIVLYGWGYFMWTASAIPARAPEALLRAEIQQWKLAVLLLLSCLNFLLLRRKPRVGRQS